MQKRGRTVLYIAGAEVLHYRGKSAARNPELERLRQQSHVAYYEKHLPTWTPLLRALPQSHGQGLTRMRIAIDARKLRDFGIGTYIRNILIELSRLDRETEYVVLCRPDDVESGDVLGRNFRMVPETAPTYSIAEQFRIPLSLAREGVRLVHEPHYVLPPLIRCRSVVTIHDCIHLMFPQYLPSKLAYVYAKGSMWSATRKANRILTVSEASKRDILRFFDVPSGESRRSFTTRSTSGSWRRPIPSGWIWCGSAISSITRSCCMSATSSRTRTSSG